MLRSFGRLFRASVVVPITALAFLLLAACGTDPNVFHAGCDHISSIDVGDGLTPSIGWSPDCRVSSLAVYEALPIPPPQPGEDPVPTLPGDQTPGYSGGSQQWRITSPEVAGNLIEPSVRYGQVPGNADEQQAAVPLMAGKHYIVELLTRPIDATHGATERRTVFER